MYDITLFTSRPLNLKVIIESIFLHADNKIQNCFPQTRLQLFSSSRRDGELGRFAASIFNTFISRFSIFISNLAINPRTTFLERLTAHLNSFLRNTKSLSTFSRRLPPSVSMLSTIRFSFLISFLRSQISTSTNSAAGDEPVDFEDTSIVQNT